MSDKKMFLLLDKIMRLFVFSLKHFSTTDNNSDKIYDV